jgi:hypothetical protein
MRWAIDGMGKVAGKASDLANDTELISTYSDPGWANYMKLLVRQRTADQQARAIAQSIATREHGARQ